MAGFLSEELEKYISDHSEKTDLNEQSLRDETLKLGPPSAMMSGDSVGNIRNWHIHWLYRFNDGSSPSY